VQELAIAGGLRRSGRLIPAKRGLLARAANASGKGRTAWGEYDEFLQANAALWLDDYALFRVLKTAHGERPWPEWEQGYVRREPAALARARDTFRDTIERARVTQFLFDRQWRALKDHASERGVCLFGDMPIYIALDSADAWAHPEMLLIDRDGRPSHVAGVPPDYFSEDGQLWGNPLYDWAYHERTGLGWWVERVRHAARQTTGAHRPFPRFRGVLVGAVRRETAKSGEWLRPGDALFVALEKRSASC
jgi:4-alpha-glucanotransferase